MQDQSLDAPIARLRLLPLLVAAVALVLYLVTLNHWVSPESLPVTAQIGRWDNDLPASAPLLYLITRPLALLPVHLLPIAANVFTALLAALTVGVLTRCVQLLPQDRTHSQRIRGHSDGRLLDIPLSWVPPVLAAALFGLQLTVWEHSTAATGEILNVLIFAGCVWLLLEFRQDQRESRLNAFAALLGLGIANNWAMVGFAPLFIGALFWVGGWTMLNVGRLLRLFGFGLLGLLLFLLMPLIGRGHGGLPESFGSALVLVLQMDKASLLGVPRSRFILLAAVMLLPLVIAGVRWGSPRGSGVERMITHLVVTVLQLVWLGGNIWFAFDPFISPRELVTVAVGYNGIALLTFHFCGALAVGYLSGYFVLLGSIEPDRQWVRDGNRWAPVTRTFAYSLALVAVGVPALLVVRNWPAIHTQNGPILSDWAAALVEPLPKEPAVVLTEDGFLYALFNAQLRRDPTLPPHLAINTRLAPEAAYRRFLAREHGQRWTNLTAVAQATENVGGVFLEFLNTASYTGHAFYLNPAVTFIGEQNQLRTRGAIFQLAPYAPNQIQPTPMTEPEVKALETFWQSHAEAIARVRDTTRHTAAIDYAAVFWSRAANCGGVELQRNDRLEPAGRLFALATNIYPANVAARVNASVNTRLRAHQAIEPAVRQPIEPFGVGIIDSFGPIDEPRFLEQFGDALLTLGDPLVRASALSFLRAQKLDPGSLDAAIGYARACLGANEPDLALAALGPVRELAAQHPPKPAQSSHMARVEANAYMHKGDAARAERVLLEALDRLPGDLPLLDLTAILFVETREPQKAIPYVDRMLKLKADDESLLERKGYLQLAARQYDDAVQTLDQVLSRRPDQASARMNRGTAHLLNGNFDAAKQDFESVLRRSPERVDALVGLAEVANGKKDKPEMIRLLEKARDLLPPENPIRSNLVQRLAKLMSVP